MELHEVFGVPIFKNNNPVKWKMKSENTKEWAKVNIELSINVIFSTKKQFLYCHVMIIRIKECYHDT